jgi:hypothetical protein
MLFPKKIQKAAIVLYLKSRSQFVLTKVLKDDKQFDCFPLFESIVVFRVGLLSINISCSAA